MVIFVKFLIGGWGLKNLDRARNVTKFFKYAIRKLRVHTMQYILFSVFLGNTG